MVAQGNSVSSESHLLARTPGHLLLIYINQFTLYPRAPSLDLYKSIHLVPIANYRLSSIAGKHPAPR
jgi:hypothetical protein